MYIKGANELCPTLFCDYTESSALYQPRMGEFRIRNVCYKFQNRTCPRPSGQCPNPHVCSLCGGKHGLWQCSGRRFHRPDDAEYTPPEPPVAPTSEDIMAYLRANHNHAYFKATQLTNEVTQLPWLDRASGSDSR